ncbi:MAG: pyruvate ferredoxin oxidoreductase [Prevotella sp.]
MDYRYIEQLLERYWQCQTSLEEETILRAFFAQEDVPMHLLPYRQLFLAEHEERERVTLGDDFDRRMMAIISNEEPVQARQITFAQRFRPFFRAAAVIAIMLTLGTAAQKALEHSEAPYPGETTVRLKTEQGPSVAINDSVRKDTTSAKKVNVMVGIK